MGSESKRHSDNILELQKTNSEQLDRIEQLTNENNEIRESMRQIGDDSGEKNNEIKRLKQIIENLKNQLRQKISENRDLDQTVSKMVDDHDLEVSQLTEGWKANYDEVQRLTTILNEILGLLGGDNGENIKDRIQKIMIERDSIQGEISSMQTQIDELRKLENKKEEELEEDNNLIKSLQERLKKCEEEVAQRQLELDSYIKALGEWEEAYHGLEERILDMERTHNMNLEKKEAEIRKIREDQKIEMEDVETESAERLRRYRKQIEDKNEKLRNQQETIDNLKKENEQLKIENIRLRDTIEELELRLRKCEDKLERSRAELININQELTDLKQRIEEEAQKQPPAPEAPQSEPLPPPSADATEEGRNIVRRSSTVIKPMNIPSLEGELSFRSLKNDEKQILKGMRNIKIIGQAYNNAFRSNKRSGYDDQTARQEALRDTPSLFDILKGLLGAENDRRGDINLSMKSSAPKNRLLIIGLVCNYIKQHTGGHRKSVLTALSLLLHFSLRYYGYNENESYEFIKREIKVEATHLEITEQMFSILETWFNRLLQKGRWPRRYVQKSRNDHSTHMRGSTELFKLPLDEFIGFLKLQNAESEQYQLENLLRNSRRRRFGGRRTMKKKRRKRNNTLKNKN